MSETDHDLPVRLYQLLIDGAEFERKRAIRHFHKLDHGDRRELIDYIRRGLCEHYLPGGRNEQLHPQARVRSWLIGGLARLIDDTSARELFFDHLYTTDRETDAWVRYWALASLVADDYPDIGNVARQILDIPDNPAHRSWLVRMLATAILAARGETGPINTICAALAEGAEPHDTRCALRALRIVSVPETVSHLCRILRHTPTAQQRGTGEELMFHDEPMDRSNYDAAVALSLTPPKHSQLYQKAGRALLEFVEDNRDSTFRSGIRTRAIRSLGEMRFKDAIESLLIEIQTPENASLLEESACAIQGTLGTEPAVNRMLEHLAKLYTSGHAHGDEFTQSFARALRALRDREAVVDALTSLLASSSDDLRHVAERMLTELGGAKALSVLRARTDAVKRYEEQMKNAEQGVRELVERNMKSARGGYFVAVGMDVIIFAAGLVLVFWAAYSMSRDHAEKMLVLLQGIVGTGGVVYELITGPRKRVGRAIDELMKLQIIFLSYLRRLYQIDQAFARRMIEAEHLDMDELRAFGSELERILWRAIKSLAKSPPGKGSSEAMDSEDDEGGNGGPLRHEHRSSDPADQDSARLGNDE